MSETIYKHVTSTFRIVSGIVLSRLHLQLKSNGVVMKDIPITSITARVSWIQNNINCAIVSVSDLNIFTVTLLHSPHYSGFKMVHQLGHSPWSIALVSFDLKVMCLHSASVTIEPRPPGSGNTGLCRSTRCLGTHLVPVSLDLAAKASSVSEYRLLCK